MKIITALKGKFSVRVRAHVNKKNKKTYARFEFENARYLNNRISYTGSTSRLVSAVSTTLVFMNYASSQPPVAQTAAFLLATFAAHVERNRRVSRLAARKIKVKLALSHISQ